MVETRRWYKIIASKITNNRKFFNNKVTLISNQCNLSCNLLHSNNIKNLDMTCNYKVISREVSLNNNKISKREITPATIGKIYFKYSLL